MLPRVVSRGDREWKEWALRVRERGSANADASGLCEVVGRDSASTLCDSGVGDAEFELDIMVLSLYVGHGECVSTSLNEVVGWSRSRCSCLC